MPYHKDQGRSPQETAVKSFEVDGQNSDALIERISRNSYCRHRSRLLDKNPDSQSFSLLVSSRIRIMSNGRSYLAGLKSSQAGQFSQKRKPAAVGRPSTVSDRWRPSRLVCRFQRPSRPYSRQRFTPVAVYGFEPHPLDPAPELPP
jgi:hypothetical protein